MPPHRRIDAAGRPTVGDLEERIRAGGSTSDTSPAIGLLAIELKATRQVIGYCGLLDNSDGPTDEAEIAYELLRRFWGHGYVTEAASAVLEWATSSGLTRVTATVRVWNTPSRRVLAKLGFVRTGPIIRDELYGDNLVTTRLLSPDSSVPRPG